MSITEKVPENILGKIQGLLAMKEGATTQGELENATSLINKLLTKYNIDLMDVKNHKIGDDDIAVEKGEFDDYQTPYDGDFAQNLLSTLAYFNMCQMVLHPTYDKKNLRNKGRFTILGKKHNIAITSYMYDFCLNGIKMLFNEHWEKYSKQINKSKNPYKRAYYRGAVKGILYKLSLEKIESEKTYGKERMNELMKLNDSAVTKRKEEMFPKLKNGRKSKPVEDADAVALGFKAGLGMNLAKGIGGEAGNTSLLKDKPKLLSNGNY